MIARRRLGVVVAWIALLSAAGGCARDEDLAEAVYVAEYEGAKARIWIPVNEPRSIGTYRAEVDWPDGTRDRIEAERNGMVAGVWLSDLEGDGTLELVVAMSSAGSGTYGSADVYRNRDGKLTPVGLSSLDDAQHPGYMGHDTFSVVGGRLLRSYPVYRSGDPNAAPTGGTVRLSYSFADSAWVSEAGPDEGRPAGRPAGGTAPSGSGGGSE
jgi:hypothetical protein